MSSPATPAKETVMYLTQLKQRNITELNEVARDLKIEGAANLRKQELIFAILQAQTEKNGVIYGEGVLETLPDGFGFLRSPAVRCGPATAKKLPATEPGLQGIQEIRGR